MASIRRILVAVKHPHAAPSPALLKAAQLAQALGARLELFHALSRPIFVDAFGGGARQARALESGERARAIRDLEALAARLLARSRHPPARVSVSVEWDSPSYEAIIRRAIASRADLIVADRHQRHLAPLVLRFGDWELLRQSPVPVLLVKRAGRYRRPAVLAAVDPAHTADKGARLDTDILCYASEIASALRGPLHTVHAYGAMLAAAWIRAAFGDSPAALEASVAAAARRRYERLVAGFAVPKPRRHLVGLPPVDGIRAVAAHSRTAIAVLGAVSRRGWRRLLIGNTAESLLDLLGCDLLIVKPPGFRPRIARRPTGMLWMSTVPQVP